MRKFLPILFVVSLGLSGCGTPANVAQTAVNVIQGILNVAKAEQPLMPVGDQVAYGNYITAVQTANSTLAMCNASISSVTLNASSKFLACFNSFAKVISDPATLAQLRIISAGSQGKAESIITGVVVAVNAAVTYFGGATVPTPAVAAEETTNSPITAELIQ